MTITDFYLDSDIQVRSIAYCKGFVDAFEQGVSNNPYDGGSFNQAEQQRHLLYKIGYEAGITEYCNANHPEE
jgi:hypothetical protein